MVNNSFDYCNKFFENNDINSIDNMITESTDSSEFRNKINELTQQLPAILSDFVKYYVFYNKNPEYEEYRNFYFNAKNNLIKIGSDAFALSNNIQYNTDKLNEKMNCLNIAINKERKINRKLKIGLGIIENKNDASEELINDYEQIYQLNYLKNFGLFLSIIVVFFVVKNMFSNINGEINPNVKSVGNNIGNSVKDITSNVYKNIKNVKR
jgi:hypothetical protein